MREPIRGHGTANPSYVQRPAYQGALLGGFALVAAAVLSVMDAATAPAIQVQARAELQAALAEVVPAGFLAGLAESRSAAAAGNAAGQVDLLTHALAVETGPRGAPLVVYRARAGGDWAAFALPLVADGYAGPIRLLLGLDASGRILGLRVLSHQETPGLGDWIERERSDWVLAFEGRWLGDPPTGRWAVKKDGGVFDSFSGATITPRRIVAAVREGLIWFQEARPQLMAAPAAPVATDEGDMTPTAEVEP